MNASKSTILIITSRTGGGHLSLSHALAGILGDDYTTTIIDPNPAIIRHYYTWVGRHFLSLWALSYHSSDTPQAALRLHKLLTLLVLDRIVAVIERTQPCLVISTHTLLSYATARAIEQTRRRIPLVFQFSELESVHHTWLAEKNADAYLVPTREILAQATSSGIPKNRLHLTGTPVRQQFLQDYRTTRAEILSQFSFDPTIFTVFLQGGAEGAAGIDHTVQNILACDTPIQIIMATGTNTHLAARFSGIRRLRALPFTEDIAPYMAAADLIIGKAGPNAIAEAVMLTKPFLATAFIPGQEAPNLAFLERHNLGWVALQPGNQQQIITDIFNDPSLIAAKLESIRAYRAWNLQANQNILPIINGLL